MVYRSLHVAVVVLVGGCSGGAGRPGSVAPPVNPNSPDATLVSMISCYRAHGLPSFPDPVFDPNDGRWHLANERPDITPQVEQACAAVTPHQAPPSPIPSAQLRDLLDFVKCMRVHGLPNFPDPTVDGWFHVLGTSLKTDPVARSASTACERYLASSGGHLQIGH